MVHRKNYIDTNHEDTEPAIKHYISNIIYHTDYWSASYLIYYQEILRSQLVKLFSPHHINLCYIHSSSHQTFITLFRRQTPRYIITNLNTNHPVHGYRTTNIKRRQLLLLMTNRTTENRLHFSTY